ncbi:CAP domain-containing protein [Nostoc sp. CENA67]|uniref:CAP domain-containing protein n=1 Tax=Amazonocrinis nigriterrae CENA67 TaxID=2794033 RepID=A0A8J7HTY4_9NOST|nr:CAP domain-containing protein [Amazonocrinis nigriterrae]MBH8565662.1 CAP domain-containing protein [Amazonocrinis nigriterrae CENA67]
MKRTNNHNIILGTLFLTSVMLGIATPSQSYTVKRSHTSSYDRQVAQSTIINTAALEDSVFQQINSYRATQNLPALLRNSAIDTQARSHSQNMASGKVRFGHDGFVQRVQATRLFYILAAENVAYNRGYQDPAKQAVQGWLKSPGHLNNIKGQYNLTGIGVASNSKGEIYFTQIFIRV